MTQRFNMLTPHLFQQVICFSAPVSLLLLLGPPSLADYHPSDSVSQLGDEMQTTVRGGRVYTPLQSLESQGKRILAVVSVAAVMILPH